MMIQCEKCGRIYSGFQYGKDFGLCFECDRDKINAWYLSQANVQPRLMFRERYENKKRIQELFDKINKVAAKQSTKDWWLIHCPNCGQALRSDVENIADLKEFECGKCHHHFRVVTEKKIPTNEKELAEYNRRLYNDFFGNPKSRADALNTRKVVIFSTPKGRDPFFKLFEMAQEKEEVKRIQSELFGLIDQIYKIVQDMTIAYEKKYGIDGQTGCSGLSGHGDSRGATGVKGSVGIKS
jgi:hypothetical protein